MDEFPLYLCILHILLPVVHYFLFSVVSTWPRQATVMLCLGIKAKVTKSVSWITYLLEHIALSRHFTVMKIQTDSLCPACGEEVEISYHLLAYMSARHFIVWRVHPVEPEAT